MASTQTCPNCAQLQPGNLVFCAFCGSPLPGLGTGNLPPNVTLQGGRYAILGTVGRGGMGAVYRAADTRLGGKVVAIKEMSDAGLPTPQQRQQAVDAFRQEAQMLAMLNHLNLPKVTDFFSENGKHYIVMEFVEGQTLENYLSRRGGPASETEARGWVAQLCNVLGYLHRQQPPVIFRDLKPANVMLTPDGQLKLIDFGIARFFKVGKPGDTLVMGTPGYAAPEQYGQGQTDARSDVYSLGVVLHQALTAYDPTHTPFVLPAVRQLNPQVSTQMQQAIFKAIQVDPRQRFQSVDDLCRALGSTAATAIVPGKGRPRWTVVAAGLALLALLCGGAYGVFTWLPRADTPGATPEPGRIVVVSHTVTPTDALPTPTAEETEGAPTVRVVGSDTPSATSSPTEPFTATPLPTATELPSATPTAAPTGTPTSSPTPLLPGLGQGRIVFVSERDGNPEVYSMAGDGSSQTRLTRSGADDWSPAWSPDGRRIAFTSSRDATVAGMHNIYVMDADGDGVTRLTYNQAWDDFPAFSPDGRTLAFVTTADGNAEISTVDSGGSGYRRLTYDTADDRAPDWSPDGQRIAYSSRRSGVWQIYVMGADGSNPTRLTFSNANDQEPAWSPDGKRIAFFSDRDGNAEIYIMDINGGSQTRLTFDPARDEHPTWSPDSSAIAFWSNRGGRNNDVYVMWADGSQPIQLTGNPAPDGAPDWTH